MSARVTEVRTALFPVSEYGEFHSLVDIAKLVKADLGLHPVFLFTAGYGAVDAHSRILEQFNFSWTTANTVGVRFDARSIQPGISDYVPAPYVPAETASQKAGTKARPDTSVSAPDSPAKTPGAMSNWALQAYGVFLHFNDRLRRRRVNRENAQQMRLADRRVRVRKYHTTRLAVVSQIVADFNPAIIISGQDFPLSVTTLAAFAGAQRGIQTVIIPFSMTPTTKEIAESFFGSRTNELNPAVARRLEANNLGKWVNVYRGRLYTRLSLLEALTSDSLGLTPIAPWTPNSGRGVVFAPSQQGYDYCLSAGIPESNLRLTGAVWSDLLLGNTATREARRNALMLDILVFETYARNMARSRTVPRRPDPIRVEAADRARPILIFSWPPNQSPRRPSGLSTFDQLNTALVEMLISLAMSTSVKIAISLHPTLVGTSLGADLKSAGLYVLDQQLIKVIDCADIFCATVSSTLMWSVQQGIPSVNFDIYNYGYSEFVEAGMIETSTISSLRQELMRLIEDVDYRQSATDRITAVRDYWALADGNAKQRILEQISQTLAR